MSQHYPLLWVLILFRSIDLATPMANTCTAYFYEGYHAFNVRKRIKLHTYGAGPLATTVFQVEIIVAQ